MNKKIIAITVLLILIQSHHSLCMENTTNTRPSWDIFGYLNWHNSPFKHTINMCEEVERLINEDSTIVNKKEISMMSRFHGMTPLEVAVTESKCEKCITLLRQHGAQDTKYIRYWQEHYANK